MENIKIICNKKVLKDKYSHTMIKHFASCITAIVQTSDTDLSREAGIIISASTPQELQIIIITIEKLIKRKRMKCVQAVLTIDSKHMDTFRLACIIMKRLNMRIKVYHKLEHIILEVDLKAVEICNLEATIRHLKKNI